MFSRFSPLALIAFSALLALQPPAAAEEGAVLTEDRRLALPVSVNWSKTSLYEALKELSRATGAYITPERKRVDEPLMGITRQMPAHELMVRIARIYNYTWIRSGGTRDRPNYLLYQTPQAAREEEAMVSRQHAAVQQALDEEIARYRKLGALPPDQLQNRLAESDLEFTQILGSAVRGEAGAETGRRMMDLMAVRSVASPAGRAMLGLLSNLSPAAWDLLLKEGTPIVYSTAPVAGELPMPQGTAELLQSHQPAFPFPSEAFEPLGAGVKQGIEQMNTMMRESWRQAPGFRATIELSLGEQSMPMGILQVAPEPISSGAEPDPAQQAMVPMFRMSGLNIIGMPGSLMEQMKRSPEEEAALARDPLLGRKAILTLPAASPSPVPALGISGRGHKMVVVAAAVSKAFDVPILGDAYNRQSAVTIALPEKSDLPLYQVLDKMAGTSRIWERDGESIRFRSKTWAFDRRAEIPLRYIQKWTADREKRGFLDLESLSEIAALLNDPQVDSLIFSALESGSEQIADFAQITQNRDILRFWHSLLPFQKILLRKGGAVPAERLFPHQKQALLLQTRRKNKPITGIFMGSSNRRLPSEYLSAAISYSETGPPEAGDAEAKKPPGQAGAAHPGGGGPNYLGAVQLRIQFQKGGEQLFTIPIFGAKRGPASPPPR